MTIRTFEGRPDSVATSTEALSASLNALSVTHRNKPLLINLYGSFGILIIGVGASHTTVEMMTAARDQHIRSLSSLIPAPEPVPFIYQGELTEVGPKFLISETDGQRAAITWLESGFLDPGVKWSVIPWPPKKWTRKE